MRQSVIGTGLNTLRQAYSAASRTEELGLRRREENEMKKQARKQKQFSGLATGATLGTQISPGWGTVIGGAIGLLGGSLF